MSITLHLPPDAERAFRKAWGDELDRKGLEAMAIEGYREKKLSIGKLVQVLALGSTHAAEEWLANRGVPLNYSGEDLLQDAATLQALRRSER